MQSVLDLNCNLPEANKQKKKRKKNLQAEFRDMNSIYKWFEDEWNLMKSTLNSPVLLFFSSHALSVQFHGVMTAYT